MQISQLINATPPQNLKEACVILFLFNACFVSYYAKALCHIIQWLADLPTNPPRRFKFLPKSYLRKEKAVQRVPALKNVMHHLK